MIRAANGIRTYDSNIAKVSYGIGGIRFHTVLVMRVILVQSPQLGDSTLKTTTSTEDQHEDGLFPFQLRFPPNLRYFWQRVR